MEDKVSNSISFFSKDKLVCPVCESKFYKEELRTGRGRLNAGELTEELRRLYVSSKKYGDVYPLNYPVVVCPSCFYSTYYADFDSLPSDQIETAKELTEKRKSIVEPIFGALDYESPRGLKEGAASYFLALTCYDFFPHERNPVIKQGLSAIRGAWLLGSLHEKFPGENYDYLSKLLYRKASFFYNLAIEYDGKGIETLAEAGNLGPDLDKNYGYDGVLYIAALLEYYYGSDDNEEKRLKALTTARTTVGRIFGMGKSSKSKPGSLLEKAKDLHTAIGNEIKRRTEK